MAARQDLRCCHRIASRGLVPGRVAFALCRLGREPVRLLFELTIAGCRSFVVARIHAKNRFAPPLESTLILPVFQPTPGALPARFRRERLLIVGCGDIGLRVARNLPRSVRVVALTSSPDRVVELRALGIAALQGNLDSPASLRRLAGLATRVLHLAPPPGQGPGDPRTAALLRALHRRTLPKSLVYGSTSGVYGDCGGDLIDETRRIAPATERARRRVAAEQAVRAPAQLGTANGRQASIRSSILRIPGIYAANRVGGTPQARLLRGTPVLQQADDVFTNHVHADDLARACIAALWRGAAQRIYHASDDTQLRMGDYFDSAADLYGLPRPPRLSRADAALQMPALQLSFMAESRRMTNQRLKQELRIRLRYPNVLQGLARLE